MIPRIPTLIPHIPTLIPCIPTLIPSILTLIPRIAIIPLTPFPDPSFRLLQIIEKIDSLHRGNQLYSLALLHYLHPGLTLFRMGFFGAVYGWGGAKKAPSLKSVTHILQYLKKIQILCKSRDTPLEFCMSAKMATPGFLKIKVFWRKDYYVIISADDVTNKILLHHSNYSVSVVIWSKFGNSSISVKEVIITSIL